MIAIWGIVQPLRSSDAYNSALTHLTRGNTAAALTDARRAQSSDPVSVDPLWLESAIYSSAGDQAAARRALIRATSVQPSNPETWTRLGCYDIKRGQNAAAGAELGRASSLLPGVTAIRGDSTAYCAAVNA